MNGLAPSLNSFISKRTGIDHGYNIRFRENLDVPMCRTDQHLELAEPSTRNSKKLGAKLEVCHTENWMTD